MIFFVLGVLSIQNDPTRSKSSQESMVSSASAFSDPERTYDVLQHEYSSSLQRTFPALQLESSKSASDYDKEETLYIKKSFSTDEPIDVLTSLKHINQIDGNNLEVKPGEYYPYVIMWHCTLKSLLNISLFIINIQIW